MKVQCSQVPSSREKARKSSWSSCKFSLAKWSGMPYYRLQQTIFCKIMHNFPIGGWIAPLIIYFPLAKVSLWHHLHNMHVDNDCLWHHSVTSWALKASFGDSTISLLYWKKISLRLNPYYPYFLTCEMCSQVMEFMPSPQKW